MKNAKAVKPDEREQRRQERGMSKSFESKGDIRHRTSGER
jgi:hypothetical protein